MGFIKGPVCRGSVALNVINDYFWVFFANPDNPAIDEADEFYATQSEKLSLPASTEDIYTPLRHWRKYAAQQKALLAEKDQFLYEHLGGSDLVSLDLVWDGNGTNGNAALTVFRHFDSATVEQGLLGTAPKTAWLIGYSVLERIHYLLVAGYDVSGAAQNVHSVQSAGTTLDERRLVRHSSEVTTHGLPPLPGIRRRSTRPP